MGHVTSCTPMSYINEAAYVYKWSVGTYTDQFKKWNPMKSIIIPMFWIIVCLSELSEARVLGPDYGSPSLQQTVQTSPAPIMHFLRDGNVEKLGCWWWTSSWRQRKLFNLLWLYFVLLCSFQLVLKIYSSHLQFDAAEFSMWQGRKTTLRAFLSHLILK